MATLKTGYCAESGSLITLQSAANMPSVNVYTPPYPGGTYAFRHNWKGTGQCKTYAFSGTPWITVSGLFWFNNVSPAGDCDFLQFEDGSGNCWHLAVLASPWSGAVGLYDKNLVLQIQTANGFLSANTWYAVQVKFKHSTSTSIDVWIWEAWKSPKRALHATAFNCSNSGTTCYVYTYNGISYLVNFRCPYIVVQEDTHRPDAHLLRHGDRLGGQKKQGRLRVIPDTNGSKEAQQLDETLKNEYYKWQASK